MTDIWPRRAWAAAATVAAIAIAGFASDADASTRTLVGVDHVTFAWPPASGQPAFYIVSRSLNGGALTTYAYASTTQIQIPVAPGNQVRISVAAAGYDSAGVFRVGPPSPLSDLAVVQRAPLFSAAGMWLLRCVACPKIERRWLADASRVVGSAPGLPWPWDVLGHAALDEGSDAIVWHNRATGALAVWASGRLVPIPGAVGSSTTTLRGVGGADLDRDGVEEFLIQRTDTLAVSAWGLTPGGFRRVALLSGPPGANLAAARDFDLDGRVDLLWQDPVAGTIDLARFAANPIFGTILTTLSTLLPTRISSAIPGYPRVASTGDYDGDRSPDLLLRYDDGSLAILYLNKGVPRQFAWLPWVLDDNYRLVIGSANVDATPGDEIALRHRVTGDISIRPATNNSWRIVVLTPGAAWKALDVDS